jgi:hypothetical protein
MRRVGVCACVGVCGRAGNERTNYFDNCLLLLIHIFIAIVYDISSPSSSIFISLVVCSQLSCDCVFSTLDDPAPLLIRVICRVDRRVDRVLGL